MFIINTAMWDFCGYNYYEIFCPVALLKKEVCKPGSPDLFPSEPYLFCTYGSPENYRA
jgi:hypothetical protein